MAIRLALTIVNWSSDKSRFWRTKQSSRVNGYIALISELVKESRFGLMDPCMKDGGETTKLMEKADSSTLMVMFTMECGSTIKLMDTVSTAILMEPSMKEIGRKINNMDRVLRRGQMVPNTTVNMYMERSTGKADSLGPMVAPILDNSKKTIFKVMALITGLTEECSLDPG